MTTFRVKINYQGKHFYTHVVDEPNDSALNAAASVIEYIEALHPDKDISDFSVHSAKPIN